MSTWVFSPLFHLKARERVGPFVVFSSKCQQDVNVKKHNVGNIAGLSAKGSRASFLLCCTA